MGNERIIQKERGQIEPKYSPQPDSKLRTAEKLVRAFKIGSLPVLLLALILLAYLAYLFLLPKPPPTPDATWTQIQNTHVLKIGVDPSSPPFVVDDGKGNLSGFDVALANELAQQWGVKIQYVYTGFDGLYDALNGNQFDMILSALPYNPDKTQDVSFSRAYFNDGPVLIVKNDDTATTGLESLQGRGIGVELGSSGDAQARKWQPRYKFITQTFDTEGQALSALQNGQVSAVIVDPIALFDFQKATPDPNVAKWRTVGPPLADENYVIAVRQDSPTLLGEINDVLNGLDLHGRLQELEKENF